MRTTQKAPSRDNSDVDIFRKQHPDTRSDKEWVKMMEEKMPKGYKYEKICVNCQTVFLTNHATKITCSDQCSHERKKYTNKAWNDMVVISL